MHTVCVSEQVLAELEPDPECVAGSEHEWTSARSLRRADARRRILNGERHRQVLVSAFGLVAHRNNAHVYTRACRLVEVRGTAHGVVDEPDIVHVHVTHPEVECAAPPALHARLVSSTCVVLGGEVYVCASSGRAHVCTETECDAQLIETLDGVCCSLTGKTLAVNQAMYRHDWMQGPGYMRPGEDDPLPKASRAARARLSESTGIMAKLQLLGREHELGEHAVQRRKAAMDALVRAALDLIVHLFPGSPRRVEIERKEDLGMLVAVYTHYWRAVNSSCQRGVPLFLDRLRHDVRSATKCDEVRALRVDLVVDPMKTRRIANGYARGVVRHLLKLCKLTGLPMDSVSAFSNTVVALLYMQRKRSCIQGVDVFVADSFLDAVLPNSARLGAYITQVKLSFTNTRNTLLQHINDAVHEHRAMPTELQCEPMPLFDVFV